eukprot:scaffold37432_cov124-Isochrysis_galbana.AAC.1
MSPAPVTMLLVTKESMPGSSAGVVPQALPEMTMLLWLGSDVHLAIFLELSFEDASALRSTCAVWKAVSDDRDVRSAWMSRQGDTYRAARAREQERLALQRMRRQYIALDDQPLEIECDAGPKCGSEDLCAVATANATSSYVKKSGRTSSSKRQLREIAQRTARAAALRKQQAFFTALDGTELERDRG